jgi:hypothetical protein
MQGACGFSHAGCKGGSLRKSGGFKKGAASPLLKKALREKYL